MSTSSTVRLAKPPVSEKVNVNVPAVPLPAAGTTDVGEGSVGSATMVKVRDMNWRAPMPHPFRKKKLPVSLVWPAAAPGDTVEGYKPSNWLPAVMPGQGTVTGNREFWIFCGVVQSSRSRLVAVE